MIKCEHVDCGYEAGWTHKEGDNNKFIDPPEGGFYTIMTRSATATAERHRGANRSMELLGCPKCRRIFMSDGERYRVDVNPSHKE